MARDAGLMTPTTSPPRLASERTFTHVRATAGVHVMLSSLTNVAAAEPLSTDDAISYDTESVAGSAANGLVDDANEAVRGASDCATTSAALSVRDISDDAVTSRSIGPYCHAPAAADTVSAIAAARRNVAPDHENDDLISPHQ